MRRRHWRVALVALVLALVATSSASIRADDGEDGHTEEDAEPGLWDTVRGWIPTVAETIALVATPAPVGVGLYAYNRFVTGDVDPLFVPEGSPVEEVGAPVAVYFATVRSPLKEATTNSLHDLRRFGAEGSWFEPDATTKDIPLYVGRRDFILDKKSDRFFINGGIDMRDHEVNAPTAEAPATAAAKAFVAHLDAADGETKRDCVVFVHGFANRFDEGLQTAMDIARGFNPKVGGEDEFPHHIIMFSMASKADVTHYRTDRDRVYEAASGLATLLSELVRSRKHEDKTSPSVHVLAHSMGCDVLKNALQRVDEDVWGKHLFGEIAIASADVGRDEFIQGGYRSFTSNAASGRILQYFNRKDRALYASSSVFTPEERVGAWPLHLDEVDSVETFNTDVVGVNHADYINSPAVLKDLQWYFTTGLSASNRPTLELRDTTFAVPGAGAHPSWQPVSHYGVVSWNVQERREATHIPAKLLRAKKRERRQKRRKAKGKRGQRNGSDGAGIGEGDTATGGDQGGNDDSGASRDGPSSEFSRPRNAPGKHGKKKGKRNQQGNQNRQGNGGAKKTKAERRRERMAAWKEENRAARDNHEL